DQFAQAIKLRSPDCLLAGEFVAEDILIPAFIAEFAEPIPDRLLLRLQAGLPGIRRPADPRIDRRPAQFVLRRAIALLPASHHRRTPSRKRYRPPVPVPAEPQINLGRRTASIRRGSCSFGYLAGEDGADDLPPPFRHRFTLRRGGVDPMN